MRSKCPGNSPVSVGVPGLWIQGDLFYCWVLGIELRLSGLCGRCFSLLSCVGGPEETFVSISF